MRPPPVGVGADAAVGLTTPHQVSQVTGDAAGGIPGRLGEAEIGEQVGHAVQHGRVQVFPGAVFWKITGSLTPFRAATSETFATSATQVP